MCCAYTIVMAPFLFPITHRRSSITGARQKPNATSATGALAVGGLVGAMTGSWLAFFVTAGVLLGVSLYAGDIRPGGRRR
jgi:hypothetical protein